MQKEFALKWKMLIIISSIILFTLITFIIIININIFDNKKILHNVIEENNKNKSLLDLASQNLLLLAKDSNEIRNNLGMSLKDYPIFKLSDENSNSSGNGENYDETDKDILFFKALEKINNNYNAERGRLIFSDFKKNINFTALIRNNGLQIQDDDELAFLLVKGLNKYFTVQLADNSSKIQIMDFMGETIEAEAFDSTISTFMQNCIQKLVQHYADLKAKILELSATIARDEMKKLLTEKHLSVSTPEEDYNVVQYIISYNKTSVLNLGVNKSDLSFFINNQNFDKINNWKEKLLKAINDLKIVADQQDKIKNSHKQLQAIFKDKAFLSLLDSNHLSIAQTPREEHYFTHYDVFEKSGTRIGSFAVENFTGEIYIMDKDEIQISSLNALADLEQLYNNNPDKDSKKKINIPEYIPEINDYYSNTAGLTFLLCGSNESNTDTIIIVNVDTIKKSITLFAIPRDLYYKGRRINTVYYNNGEDEFLKELSQITGLKIEKFIHINMFAFVEVINILGGIDITLDNDLIDPSYKVKEDGQWSTLYYKKGFYHLNGIQALRIARSRHFSSDFDRSKRQQKILIAIKNQFQTIGFTSLDKVSTIITTLLKYVKTNFSIFEILQYYNQFKDYSVDAQHTLDTANVLYSTYSNIYLLNDEEKEILTADPEFEKGAWILLPLKNDWNTIKWYIRELIN